MPIVRLVAAVLAAAVLTACGASARQQGPAEPAEPPPAHNVADVAFAQNMVPHHQQAVDMAELIPRHTSNPKMLVIARDMSADQQSEIRALSRLLDKWGESAAMDHGDHEGMPGMPGMVDPATMNQLQSLDGNAFDALWMRSMISHHRGAVAMAQDEIAHGQSQDAITMAHNIVTTQQREIAYLTHLLSPAQ
jgi:uncharacterized protein (DUF305 family)